jgi:iron complex transport system permease protein
MHKAIRRKIVMAGFLRAYSPANCGCGGMKAISKSGLWLNAALVVLVLVLMVVSLVVGPAGLPVRSALEALWQGDGPTAIIVREIRLPRTLLAALIGATLGFSGAALQGLFRNPLAEPALFGAPQAAAATSSFAIAFGLFPATSAMVPVAGILGALLSVGALVLIAGRRTSLTVILLAGLALASFAGAMTALILNLAPNPFIALEVAFWLLGSLEDRSRDHLIIAAPFMVAGWILLLSNARAFRALTLGEDAATSLGVDLQRTRFAVVLGTAFGVGSAVAVAGSIGFVGLVAPHLVRRFVDSDPTRVMLPGALAGAALLLASDIAVRLVPSAIELKVGVVTALIGVPFFLAMIFNERRYLEGETA